MPVQVVCVLVSPVMRSLVILPISRRSWSWRLRKLALGRLTMGADPKGPSMEGTSSRSIHGHEPADDTARGCRIAEAASGRIVGECGDGFSAAA